MGLSFRLAENSDCQFLFDWRMDPEARRWSLQKEAFDFNSHVRWFNRSLTNPNRLVIVAEDGARLGVVRFDRIGHQAKISINLAPEARGKGLATSILVGAEQFLRSWSVGVIVAEIIPGNEASIRAFERAGYSCESAPDQTILRYVKQIGHQVSNPNSIRG